MPRYIHLDPWSTTTPAPPTTTRPPPGGDIPPAPMYQVVVLGNFTNVNDDDFTSECTTALGNSFQLKAAQMVPGLNDMLGQDMCDYVQVGDVWIVSVFTLLMTDGSTVSVCCGCP
jgi:hypothetical protein